MTDITKTVAPKTDQLNSDDFIGTGDKKIKITGVKMMDSKEQPIAVSYEGDNGKPWKPSLGMRRVLIELWGQEAAKEADKHYPGRTIVLYRDPEVKFGKDKVGGIRIRSASDILSEMKMAVTVSKARRVEFVVKPLALNAAPANPLRDIANTIRDKIKTAPEKLDIDFVLGQHKDDLEKIKAASQPAYDAIQAAAKKREEQISQPICEKCKGEKVVPFKDEITGEEGFEPCECQKK